MKGIKVISPIADPSGYGQAAREFLYGFIENDIPFTLKRVRFSDYQVDVSFLETYLRNDFRYDACLQFLTPQHFHKYLEISKINVGYCMWETDKLPKNWAIYCNCMDKILVPCNWNISVFRDSGVTVPIEVVPIPTNISKFDHIKVLDYLDNNKLKFYSIFQHRDRKNFEALLTGYYHAFDKNHDVILIIKTYTKGKASDKKEIQDFINNISCKFTKDLPEIIVITDMLTQEMMLRIHKSCDIYVSTSRGEGFNLPLYDAMLCGNQCIYGYHTAHMDFPDAGYMLLDYDLRQVESDSMLYSIDQTWCDISLEQLIRYFRICYDHGKYNINNFKIKTLYNRNRLSRIIYNRIFV